MYIIRTCMYMFIQVYARFDSYKHVHIMYKDVHTRLFHISYLQQPVPQAYRKWCVKFRPTPSVRTGFPAVIQHSLSEHLKCLKSKTWNDLTSANLFFWECRMRSAAKRVEQSLGSGYPSKMEWFSSFPTRLSLVRVNQPIPTQFWFRNQTIWGKRISSLKSTGMWKSQIMDGVCWIMISHQPTHVMWQNRHISSQQNHA